MAFDVTLTRNVITGLERLAAKLTPATRLANGELATTPLATVRSASTIITHAERLFARAGLPADSYARLGLTHAAEGLNQLRPVAPGSPETFTFGLDTAFANVHTAMSWASRAIR